MTLSPFETDFLYAFIGVIVTILGYLIVNYVFPKLRKKATDYGEDYFKMLMDKVDLIAKEINEAKIHWSVQVEKNSNINDKISKHEERLNDHSKRIKTLENQCSKNH